MLNKITNLKENIKTTFFTLSVIWGLIISFSLYSIAYEKDITNSLIHQTEVIMANKKEIKNIEPYKDISIHSTPQSITLSYVKHRFETSRFPQDYLESLTKHDNNIKSVSINGRTFSNSITYDSQMIDNLTNINQKNTIVINY